MKYTVYAILAVCTVLIGCANQPTVLTKTEYQKEYVKVYQCPAPSIPEVPYLPIYDITNKSSPDDVSKAYGKSVDILLNENSLLRDNLSSYNKLSVTDSK